MKLKPFIIHFAGLTAKRHEFAYELNNTFFADFDYHEFNEASIQAKAILNKTDAPMYLELEAWGTVNVNCDVTNESFDLPLQTSLELVIKFDETYNGDHDEILVLPHGEHQVDISQFLYEMVVLAVPQKKEHPGLKDGTLQSGIVDKLNELQPKESKTISENTIDPRWDSLKKLLTDK